MTVTSILKNIKNACLQNNENQSVKSVISHAFCWRNCVIRDSETKKRNKLSKIKMEITISQES